MALHFTSPPIYNKAGFNEEGLFEPVVKTDDIVLWGSSDVILNSFYHSKKQDRFYFSQNLILDYLNTTYKKVSYYQSVNLDFFLKPSDSINVSLSFPDVHHVFNRLEENIFSSSLDLKYHLYNFKNFKPLLFSSSIPFVDYESKRFDLFKSFLSPSFITSRPVLFENLKKDISLFIDLKNTGIDKNLAFSVYPILSFNKNIPFPFSSFLRLNTINSVKSSKSLFKSFYSGIQTENIFNKTVNKSTVFSYFYEGFRKLEFSSFNQVLSKLRFVKESFYPAYSSLSIKSSSAFKKAVFFKSDASLNLDYRLLKSDNLSFSILNLNLENLVYFNSFRGSKKLFSNLSILEHNKRNLDLSLSKKELSVTSSFINSNQFKSYIYSYFKNRKILEKRAAYINLKLSSSYSFYKLDKLLSFFEPSITEAQKINDSSSFYQVLDSSYLLVDRDKRHFSEVSLPSSFSYPKVRYQTRETNYENPETSPTSGLLVYEGVENHNLFFYQPDSGAFNHKYFEYGKREGTFNPCEFPETADRTLDPLQISSLSNRGDNPFWYMPGILTVDSTIHTSDGAPCQFISAENDRFNSIDLENDIVLIPENNQQEGKDINFTK
jgi:hypothetical protein